MWPFRRKKAKEGDGERSLASRILRRESVVEIVQDSFQGFMAYPKATYQGIREAQLKIDKMTAFDRAVEKWEYGIFGVLFSLGIIFLLTLDGYSPLVRLLPLVVVGFMWFGRVVGWNPIRAFLRQNLTPMSGSNLEDAGGARQGASAAVVREVMALHLEGVLVLLRQWDKRPTRKERLDQAPALAFDLMNALVKCADLLEVNDIDGAMQLVKATGGQNEATAQPPAGEPDPATPSPTETSDTGRTS